MAVWTLRSDLVCDSRRRRRGGLLGAVALGLAALGASAGPSSSTVLFDQGHGQRFLIERKGSLDLSALAGLFRRDGLRVRSTQAPLTDKELIGVDALVISGAFAPLTQAEGEAVVHFVERGGRLCIMLHIPAPLAPFLARLGVVTSNGVVREERNRIGGEPLNFHVTALAPHPLLRGLERFAVYGSWALLAEGPGVAVIARSSEQAWVDLNKNGVLDGRDAQQALGIVVAGRRGRGEFAVFGDDALFQNRFLRGANVRLAQNLARWLRPQAAAGVQRTGMHPTRGPEGD